MGKLNVTMTSNSHDTMVNKGYCKDNHETDRQKQELQGA